MRPGRRRRARRHHRSRHRMRRHGEDLRLPDEDGDGKRQTPLILLYLRALHPVRCVYLGALAPSLVRSLSARSSRVSCDHATSICSRPRPGSCPHRPSRRRPRYRPRTTHPPPSTGSAPCAISARVSSSEEVCTRSARAAARFARAASEDGPTVMRLATARAANLGAAKLRSEEEIRTIRTDPDSRPDSAFFSD